MYHSGMRDRLLLLVATTLLAAASPARAQTPDAPTDTAYTPGEWRAYTGAGEPTTLDAVVQAMAAHQVVFVGETHDDPTGHMLEVQLLRRAHAAHGGPAGRPVALSLEFFERDVQLPLDEYLDGRIAEAAFTRDTRPWPRYRTDYRPLVEYAREHALPVIAANAPRRYVSMVSAHGRAALDSLSADARALLAPLPYGKASAAYRDQWIATISEVMEQEGMRCGVPVDHAPAPAGSHANMGNQLDSQVLWDATMAHSIARFLDRQPDALVLHMVGGFHVERATGTPEQLRDYRPEARFLVVMLRPVADVDVFEPAPAGTWGDFVIQTDAARTLEAIECRQFHAGRTGRP